MRKEIELPCFSLNLDEIKRLKDILISNIPLAEMSLEVSYKGFTEEYKTIDVLFDDGLLPDSIKEFNWTIYENEEVTWNSTTELRKKLDGRQIALRCWPGMKAVIIIEGDGIFVREKSSSLEQFFKDKKRFFRTFFKNGMVMTVLYCLLAVLWTITIALSLEFPRLFPLLILLFSITYAIYKLEKLPFGELILRESQQNKDIKSLFISILGGIVGTFLVYVVMYFLGSI